MALTPEVDACSQYIYDAFDLLKAVIVERDAMLNEPQPDSAGMLAHIKELELAAQKIMGERDGVIECYKLVLENAKPMKLEEALKIAQEHLAKQLKERAPTTLPVGKVLQKQGDLSAGSVGRREIYFPCPIKNGECAIASKHDCDLFRKSDARAQCPSGQDC